MILVIPICSGRRSRNSYIRSRSVSRAPAQRYPSNTRWGPKPSATEAIRDARGEAPLRRDGPAAETGGVAAFAEAESGADMSMRFLGGGPRTDGVEIGD